MDNKKKKNSFCNKQLALLILLLEQALKLCKESISDCESDKQKDILTALFDGELYIDEQIAHSQSNKHRKLSHDIVEIEEQILNLIGEKNSHLIDEFSGLYLLQNSEQSRECFIAGFQTATRLIMSGLSGTGRK